jgi:hypothetical protein
MSERESNDKTRFRCSCCGRYLVQAFVFPHWFECTNQTCPDYHRVQDRHDVHAKHTNRDMNDLARGTIGNRSRTGLRRPPGSGRPRMLGKNLTSLTIRVDMEERNRWASLARARGVSTGSLVREAMAELLDTAQELQDVS